MTIVLESAFPIIVLAYVAAETLPVPKVVKPIVGALAAILCVVLLISSFSASA